MGAKDIVRRRTRTRCIRMVPQKHLFVPQGQQERIARREPQGHPWGSPSLKTPSLEFVVMKTPKELMNECERR